MLNASHACTERSLTLTMRTQPVHALERLVARGYDFVAVLDGKRLAGVLLREDARRAVQDGARDISRYLTDMASVPATAGLDEVLAQLLRTPEPVAVTDDHGEFVGVLSRRRVVELVTPSCAAESRDQAA